MTGVLRVTLTKLDLTHSQQVLETFLQFMGDVFFLMVMASFIKARSLKPNNL
jgi:hypothetical protein